MSVKIISIHASGLPGTHKYTQRCLLRGVCLLCGGEPSSMREYLDGGERHGVGGDESEIEDAVCVLFPLRFQCKRNSRTCNVGFLVIRHDAPSHTSAFRHGRRSVAAQITVVVREIEHAEKVIIDTRLLKGVDSPPWLIVLSLYWPCLGAPDNSPTRLTFSPSRVTHLTCPVRCQQLDRWSPNYATRTCGASLIGWRSGKSRTESKSLSKRQKIK